MLGFPNKVLCKGLHVFGRNNSAFLTPITLGAVRDLASHFLCLGLRPWAFLEGTSWQLFIFLFPNIPSPPSCPHPLQRKEWFFPWSLGELSMFRKTGQMDSFNRLYTLGLLLGQIVFNSLFFVQDAQWFSGLKQEDTVLS